MHKEAETGFFTLSFQAPQKNIATARAAIIMTEALMKAAKVVDGVVGFSTTMASPAQTIES